MEKQNKGNNLTKKICWEYQRTGKCKFGNKCFFVHPEQQENKENTNTSQINNKEGKEKSKRICLRFQKGTCEFGDKCQFSHDLSNKREQTNKTGN